MTTPRTQAKSIGLVAMVNVCNAAVGVVQAFLVGMLFGTTSGIEIFFAAATFQLSIGKLLQAGQIAEIFIPIYHQLKESEGPRVAFNLLSVLLNWMLLVALVLASVMYVGVNYIAPITVPGFTPERLATFIAMFQSLIPLIMIQVGTGLLSSLLASEKQFVAQEVARTLAGFISLLMIIAFATTFDAWVMIGALWSTNTIILTVFLFFLYRIGYRHHFRLRHDKFSVTDIFKKLPSIFAYVCVTQVYELAITAGLSLLPQGSLAVYTYATRLFSRVSAILIRPVSTVFFSHFSSAVAESNAAIQEIATKALRLMLILSTLTCAGVIITGLPALRTLWLSEKFPEAQVLQTYFAFAAFCLIPIISGLGLIYRKINMAHQYTHAQYLMLVVNQIVNATLAYFMIPWFGLLGAVGVVMMAPCWSALTSGILLRVTRPERFAVYDRTTVVQCLTIFFVSVTPWILLQHGTNFYSWFPDSRLGSLAACIFLFVAASLTMVAVIRWLKMSEFESFQSILVNRVNSLRGIQKQ